MGNIKKWICLVLVACMMMTMQPVTALAADNSALIGVLDAIVTEETVDQVEVFDSGSCGDNVYWTLYSSGLLNIRGSGPMVDYSWQESWTSSAPWCNSGIQVKQVKIEKGVTYIGDYAFYQCSNLSSVTIPDGVTGIGAYAFPYCINLTSVIIPDSVTAIGDYAFHACESLTDVYYCGTEEHWAQISIGSYNAALTDATIHFEHWDDSICGFNEYIYRADYLLDDHANNLDYYVDRINTYSPTQLILSTNELESANELWQNVTMILDTIVDGDAAIKQSFQQADIYEAILLNALEESTGSDTMLPLIAGMTKDINTVLGHIQDVCKLEHNWMMATDTYLSGLSFEQKEVIHDTFQYMLKKDALKGSVEALEKSSEYMNEFMEVATTLEDFVSKVMLYANLWQISDSMADVLDAMYLKTPNDSEYDAMREALQFCSGMIRENSGDDFLAAAMVQGTWTTGGKYALTKGVSWLWGKVRDKAVIANPKLAIILAAYKAGRTVTNVLGNTDEVSEQTFKLSALHNYYEVLTDAIHSLGLQYRNNHSVSDAETLLSSLSLLFGLSYEDCDLAYCFADVVDDALLYQIEQLVTKKDSADNLKDYAMNMKAYFQQDCSNASIYWVYQLKEDYPEYYWDYAALVGDEPPLVVPITHGYTIKCPVDIYIYDSEDNLAAFLCDGKSYASGEITVSRDGEEKMIDFYDNGEYRIVCEGYDSGTMDISITEFDSGMVIREAVFYDLAVSEGKIHEMVTNTEQLNEVVYEITTDDDTVYADYDSNTAQENQELVHVEIENGFFHTDNAPAFAIDAYPGARIQIMACIPEGYEFVCWESDTGDVRVKDFSAPVTTIRIPLQDAKIRAVIQPIHTHRYTLHAFDWASNFGACSALFICADCAEIQMITCAVTSTKVLPTETEDGEIRYTATAEFDGIIYTDQQTVVIPATGTESKTVASGICGDELTWVLTENGTLKISGSGEMYNWNNSSVWDSNYEDITSVIIEEGVTSVGDYAFWCFYYLTEVSLPYTLERIGDYAFYWCPITGFVLPDSLREIGNSTFGGTDVETILIPAGVTSIGKRAFAECELLTDIWFIGDAMEIDNDAFAVGGFVDMHYPQNNETWNPDAYGTEIGWCRWQSYNPNHIWDEGIMVKESEEGTHGLLQYCCKDCGMIRQEIIHCWDAGVVTSAPGIDTEGTLTHTCMVCKGVRTECVPALGVVYTSVSLSLAGDIGVNYYAQLSDAVIADEGAYMQFTVAGLTQIVPLSEAEVSADGTYRFSCKVAAKQMTEEITGQMYLSDGTAVGDSKVYSVKAYCDAAIPVYSQYAAYADLVDLMEAMLNYGGYSQVQFGCNTDDLANSNLTDTALPAITAADVDAFAHGATGNEDGISVASVSLLLESTTTIRFYFELDGTKSIDQYKFYVDGVETTPVESNGQYYVDKVNVAAKDLDEMVTVTIGGLTVKYCGLSYVRQVAVLYPAYYSEALADVAKALYAYNQAANAYFA